MDMDMDSLKTVKPFDREFIDQMIPITKVPFEWPESNSGKAKIREAKDLATAIVDAQAVEIEQMNQWRKEWYGAVSPSGGVPSLDEMEPHAMEGMEH